MTANKILFVSDVHIGSNQTTNWYQRELHEPMLVAIFEYALANAADIAEFIILGDLIDQWTYVPGVRPPSLEEIAAVNPQILGKDGMLAKLAQAMPERVTYMPGNHDMALTAEALSAVVGQPIRGASGLIYTPKAGDGQVACTHGHIYSIFNAPDPVGDPRHALPLGHFMTRLSALDAWRKLGPTQNVADLAQSGDPTGAALLGDAFKGIIETFMTSDASLARAVMDTLLSAVKENAEMPYVMLDDSKITGAEVIKAYDNLFERYGSGSAYPPSIYGRAPALQALVGTDARNTIAHFADVLSSKYPVIVMGHTHTPDDESDDPLFGKPYAYVNSGFNCPSKPDIAAKNSNGRATFVEITIDSAHRRFDAAVRYVEQVGERMTVASSTLGPVKTAPMR